MIEQLGIFLAKVLLNKKSGDFEGAVSNIETAASVLLGIDTRLLEKLSVQEIGELFGISKDPCMGSMKCLAAARLMKEKNDILVQTGAKSDLIRPRYLKALRLYLKGLSTRGTDESDLTGFYDEAGQIIDNLGNSTPPDLRMLIDSIWNNRTRA